MTFKNLGFQWLFLLALIFSYLVTFSFANDDDNDEESNSEVVVILFMFFGLGLGIVVMQIISYFGEVVPYTVVVFILGVIFSAANKNTGILSYCSFKFL